ncbi:hypothetical protein V8B97DRAFT_1968788 [Scleroderma yunnanense]
MFTYDGIRSQLEWFSTLNISNAPVPTPETKFLRKVCPPTNLALENTNVVLLDLDYRHDRSQHQFGRETLGTQACRH